MYKVLLWGTGRRYCKMINLLRFYELQSVFRVVGITSNDDFYVSVDGYPFIPKKKLREIEFDYIIVTMDDYHNIMKEAEMLFGYQISEKMIAGRVLQHPDFNMEQYSKIRKHIPSIISPNCFGGLLYHFLGLPFLSPTINMFWREEEYYKLLSNLKEYMEKPLVFKEMRWVREEKREYPVCSLGDIHVYMNHYNNYEEAKEKWEQRTKRIDYSNLFIVGRASSKYWAEKFCGLPYKNKMCFTAFKMDGCIDVTDIYNHSYLNSELSIGQCLGLIMNDSTWGKYRLYNPFQMLDTGDGESHNLKQFCLSL